MMGQFEFDLDSLEPVEPFEVTGCIRKHYMYPISSQDSSIRVVFENLSTSCFVDLDIADHPAAWDVSGEVPVSLILRPSQCGESYIGRNLKVLKLYNSFEHLPFKYIPVRDILTSTQEWIDSCPYDLLKAFMYRALGDPSTGGLFFSIPASTHRHFKEQGGLARHSLEVAQIVYSSTTCFQEHERWLAAATGLVHEVGQVRMYASDGRFKETSSFVSHEVLNFEVLGPALLELEKHWVDGAESIRHMLDNLCRVRMNSPLLPITASIRSADLMSAMNNQREQAFQDKPPSERFARVGNSVANMFWQPSAP